MYSKNLVILVESVLPMDLVDTCPALGSPLQGNKIRCDRILSSWQTATPLEVRHCGYSVADIQSDIQSVQ